MSGYGCQIAELAPDLYVMHDGDASEPLATESATSSFLPCAALPRLLYARRRRPVRRRRRRRHRRPASTA